MHHNSGVWGLGFGVWGLGQIDLNYSVDDTIKILQSIPHKLIPLVHSKGIINDGERGRRQQKRQSR